MENYYKILGIAQDANKSEIENAINKKKSVWIQRQNAPKHEKQQATRYLNMISEIEETLLNEQNRKNYDTQLNNNINNTVTVNTDEIKADELISEGWRLYHEGKIVDALAVATKATELQKNNPDAWALLGSARAKWGDIDDAIYEYKRAIKLCPNDSYFYYKLGCIYEDNEMLDKALEQYEKAILINSNETIYKAAKANIYLRTYKNHENAVELLEQCLKEKPENNVYKYLLSLAYHDLILNIWTKSPYRYSKKGRFIITESQAKQTLELIDRAEMLDYNVENFNAEQIKNDLLKMKKEAQWATSYHWDLNLNRIKGGFVSAFINPLIIFIISFGLILSGSFISIAIGVALLVFYLYIKILPGWKINKSDLDNEILLEEHIKKEKT